MVVGIDSWYLVTARSDQLIAAVKDQCVLAELLRSTADELFGAASEVSLRATFLLQRRRKLHYAGFRRLTPPVADGPAMPVGGPQ